MGSMKLLKSILINITLPYWQVITTTFTFLLAFFMAYIATTTYDSFTSSYRMNDVDPKMISEWHAVPPQVEAGLYIYKFSEFNIYENKFVFEGTIWFLFDPALLSLETINEFSFDYGEILSKGPPKVKYYSIKLFPPYSLSELIFVSYDIKVRFTNNLNYRAFPLDDHQLNIVLQNYQATPRELLFKSSLASFILSPTISISGWHVYDRQVRTGYEQAYLDRSDRRKFLMHPKVVFSIDLNRSGLKDVLLMFLPLFLILFISLYSLSLDPLDQKSIIFSLASGSLPALIAYRFIMQNMSPHVSYFMLGDYVFGISLVFAAINFVISMSFIYIGRLTPRLMMLRGILFIIFHVVFLVVWYYLMFYFVTET